MANVVVVGGQWGDEGKGKVVDLLCPAFSFVARFNGGNNAGHTVRFADRHFALHLVPSGILHPDCRCVIGPGVVVDPAFLRQELGTLEDQGVPTRGRLVISPRAHLVLPGHRALDAVRDRGRGTPRLGTTGRGIGPAYESRAARTGVRIGLARSPRRLREAVLAAQGELERQLTPFGVTLPHPDEVEQAIEAAIALAPMVGDTGELLQQAMVDGRPILFEGAQGTFLDVDHGTYPFVTSSGCLAGYAAPASGLPARALHGVLGVFKAYTTRVGEGPFPTELFDHTGDYLRKRGNEVGTTTGRPRRTGWLDTVAGRASVRLNGVDVIALTKLDVLDELEQIPVCTAYRLGEQELQHFPDDATDLANVTPVLEHLPGWRTSTAGITTFDRLPDHAKTFVNRVEELLGAPAGLISTGPRREETILRPVGPLREWLPGFFRP